MSMDITNLIGKRVTDPATGDNGKVFGGYMKGDVLWLLYKDGPAKVLKQVAVDVAEFNWGPGGN